MVDTYECGLDWRTEETIVHYGEMTTSSVMLYSQQHVIDLTQPKQQSLQHCTVSHYTSMCIPCDIIRSSSVSYCDSHITSICQAALDQTEAKLQLWCPFAQQEYDATCAYAQHMK